jgi:spore coat-associated protein N
MKRMKILVGNRRMMVLLTLAILVLAATALVASSASFTATSANPGNVFTAGALSIGNYQSDGTTDNEGQPIVTTLAAANMKPTDSVDGTAVIENTGSVAGDFTLSGAINPGGGTTTYPVTYDPFAAWLRLSVTEDGVPIPALTNITLASLDVLAPIALDTVAPGHDGVWDAGEFHAYVFTVTFPDGAAVNNFMGRSATVDFTWVAGQH